MYKCNNQLFRGALIVIHRMPRWMPQCHWHKLNPHDALDISWQAHCKADLGFASGNESFLVRHLDVVVAQNSSWYSPAMINQLGVSSSNERYESHWFMSVPPVGLRSHHPPPNKKVDWTTWTNGWQIFIQQPPWATGFPCAVPNWAKLGTKATLGGSWSELPMERMDRLLQWLEWWELIYFKFLDRNLKCLGDMIHMHDESHSAGHKLAIVWHGWLRNA